jgi:hypothetical protein
MGLRLMFIEGEDVKFVMDEWFNRKISNLPEKLADDIMLMILRNISTLPKMEGYSQNICGVIKSDTPYFYKIEFVNEDGYAPILLDIEQIGLEEYLDSINEKKYFKDGE